MKLFGFLNFTIIVKSENRRYDKKLFNFPSSRNMVYNSYKFSDA